LLADESTAGEEVCRRLDGIPLAIELAASRMESMTATEVRDRLDHRFKLLVGSRRGLERHQTLRHAVAWSYDVLDDAEKSLLIRCSVFAGGFDLQSACAVAGSDEIDDYAILDLLDALVRKSLLTADRSSGRTRYSMLETIRQFAESQLVASGAAEQVRGAHARYFAGRETDVMARCGTVLISVRPTNGSRSNSQTCARLSGGRPTRTISTRRPPSPGTGESLVIWSRTMSRSRGPKSSLRPLTPPIT
jgi:predicted ATPase